MNVTTFADAVAVGLSAEKKGLPPRYFYDARGSELYEKITQLDEYYLTRAESEILDANADDILGEAGHFDHLIELGSGSAQKTRYLLDAMTNNGVSATYHAVDISESAVEACTSALREEYPELAVEGHVGEYHGVLARLDGTARSDRFVIFLGSSIGNFNEQESRRFLDSVHDFMDTGEPFLIGMDLAKERAVLERAYDDAQGVTAEFNRNILRRINRELDADFDVDAFRHVAFFNEEKSRVEMHLESVKDQKVHIRALGQTFSFVKGETIHTENSYKYDPEMVRRMAASAGFRVDGSWTDDNEWFALYLWRRGS